ncbi:MAG: hypothetical protein MI976_19780 [Pseudomonadales bacterium]|nr:hypothetical protein [Pseudomonadales bacterium]
MEKTTSPDDLLTIYKDIKDSEILRCKVALCLSEENIYRKLFDRPFPDIKDKKKIIKKCLESRLRDL